MKKFKLCTLLALATSVMAYAGDPTGFNGPDTSGLSIPVSTNKMLTSKDIEEIEAHCSFDISKQVIMQLVSDIDVNQIKRVKATKRDSSPNDKAKITLANGKIIKAEPTRVSIMNSVDFNEAVEEEYFAFANNMESTSNGITTFASYNNIYVSFERETIFTHNGITEIANNIAIVRPHWKIIRSPFAYNRPIKKEEKLVIKGVQKMMLPNWDPIDVDRYGEHEIFLNSKKLEYYINFDEWTNCIMDGLTK